MALKESFYHTVTDRMNAIEDLLDEKGIEYTKWDSFLLAIDLYEED